MKQINLNISATLACMPIDNVLCLFVLSGCSNIQNLTINVEHEGYLAIFPNILQINGTTTGNFHIDIKALTAGETSIYLEPLPPEQM